MPEQNDSTTSDRDRTSGAASGLWTIVEGRTGGNRDVLALHGFTQTARSWDPFVPALAAAGHGVRRADLPGHGRSSACSADLPGTADLVAAAAAGPSTIVGYSLGGRVALHVALAHPGLVDHLVLVGATGGIDSATERAERRAADARLADRVAEIGVPAFLQEWLAGPLFATLTAAQASAGDRLVNTAAGLGDSLRRCGTGTQEPLWARLASVRCPVDVVVGGLDAKFHALGRRLVESLPVARLHTINGAGHACHLERPAEFQALLLDLLAERAR